MKLYFNPQSRAVIAKWMLDECGANYEIVPVDLTRGRAGRWTLFVRRLVHRGRRDDRLDVHLAAHAKHTDEPTQTGYLRGSPACPTRRDEIR
jgi:hypothetical protein